MKGNLFISNGDTNLERLERRESKCLVIECAMSADRSN